MNRHSLYTKVDSSNRNAIAEIDLIILRIDVDYPYPSRFKSFIHTTLGVNLGGDYLRNPKIVARMINESKKEVKAYWFFTPETMPDKEMLGLLKEDRHEVALHIVNNPYGELKLLEDLTGTKIHYYTIHGTSRLLARIMWKRWRAEKPAIPSDYPLQSFYQFPTKGLDVMCHICTTEQSTKMADRYISEGKVLHFHPIWLFQRGRINNRGPFYETFKRILEVDGELDTLAIRKKLFFKLAADTKEYEKDVTPSEELLEKLRERRVDIFNLLERKWCSSISSPSKSWVRAKDNIALLDLASYDEWWKSISKKTRNMVRKAEKSGIVTKIAQPNKQLAEGIWKIYNETPIRQERGFPHYGEPLRNVVGNVLSAQNSTYVGAYLQDELVGFIQLVHGKDIEVISQILSMQKHMDKAVNNALIARAVEACANRGARWVMYGRIGNHPSLDSFKQSNGWTKFQLNRYFIPLTQKGKIAIKLGLHRDLKDSLPEPMKQALLPIYNWVSRTVAKIKFNL